MGMLRRGRATEVALIFAGILMFCGSGLALANRSGWSQLRISNARQAT